MNYLFIFFTLFFLKAPSETKDLTLTITDIKQMQGTLEIGLYNNGERFLEAGHTYKTFSIDVNQSSEVLVIKNLPVGTYAVSMYHDKNSNGECDRNFLGIPKEPYAFSNNFKPKFSAPTFKDCKFELTNDVTLNIKMIN